MKKLNAFLVGRIKAFKFATIGAWLLIKTEHSIMAQLIIASVMIGLGFIYNLSHTEWMFQLLAIGLVLVAEALNTAVEKLADFIHPEFHKKIGFIKDIAAGAAFFAAIIAVIIGLIIYMPKIM